MFIKLLQGLLNKENQKLFSRYVLISIVSYIFVFSGLYLLIDILLINQTWAYMIVYGVAYIFLYAVQLRYLFNTEHDNKKFVRFCLMIVSFYAISNLLFNVFIAIDIHYLIATAITVVILMPLRLIVSKLFVYKD